MHRQLATGFACLSTLTILAGCVTAPMPTPPAVPESLAVPAQQILSRKFQADGVQIYECKSSHDAPARMDWVFRAPEAQLRDSAGHIAGRHYAGPTWEANDHSKVVAEVRARIAAPDPDAIPWLLLSATSTTGSGVFGHTMSIQRLNTSGGKAPLSGCDQAHDGQEARVPYKADYFFYALRP